ncbi:NADP-dependent oxidoreductase [Agrococcus sp. ARC_14]|uniref:NADP-dependent oxidoreductase n=1 Tax=Agrococcus sp. ARC_14 TaxID=2919927 RepID=UPI001F062700|nr:NADP-dependent oxidoreductase [Agrococcus sp. ARC_14]MCH1884270.1 NADP-dependent oxidoreductase [Agrococcus sp. ARC_14]
MRAAIYDSYGGTDRIRVTDVPEPKVGPATVLIRVRSAGVNPVDWKVMAGYLDGMFDAVFPVIPGWDVSGVVEAVGLDTPEFQVGDEVMAYARKDALIGGTFAELVAVPVRAVARKPASLDWHQAAGLPLAGLTAYQLIDRLEVAEGETVLIHNAGGGVGSLAVQIAIARGARVIGTAGEGNHERLRELGAEPVAYGDGLVERVRALAPEGVDVSLDLVGGVLGQAKALLREGGRLGSIADGSVAEHGGLSLWARPSSADLAVLARLADDGDLTVPIDAVHPLDDVAGAFERSMTGHTAGKIVIEISA